MTGYDNTQYWQTIHRDFGARLRAVGHPNLSESFNALKYASEAETLSAVLQEAIAGLRTDAPVRVLDIGAGTGYWTRLVQDLLVSRGLDVSLSALDLSADALRGIQQQLPEATLIQADLKTIAPDRCPESHDLVYTCYCLHHIPRLADFLNALTFAARSVARDGHLLLMDPVLRLPYSPFAALDFPSYRGNGVPRHLHLIDDVLDREGLTRVAIRPAVSFLLNGNIEARRAWSYALCRRLWQVLHRVYVSETLTPRFARILRPVDRWCKRTDLAFSSSVCLYRKQA